MSRGRLAVRILWRWLLAVLIIGAMLFIPAGSWGYWQAWVYCGMLFALALLVGLYLIAHDPALLERRLIWREQERQQRFVQVLMVVLTLAAYLIPGFDYRYGWSRVPAAIVLAADVVVLGAYLLMLRVFRENPFAGRTVRVEAGQTVVSSGPYAVVRHPMYVGGLLMFLFTPLALGSYWAMLAALALPVVLVLRIRNEEAVLLRELPGYEEYCRKVRWRLIPGVW